jgi:hypothetical protein
VSEEIAPIPDGILPEVLQELKEKMLSEPDLAWMLLQQNPIAVIALSRAKIELQKQEKSIDEEYHLQQFMKKLEVRADQIFDVGSFVEKDGLALTTELILGVWRKYNQEIRIHSINQLLLKNLLKLHEQTLSLDNTSENRVIREMVFDSLKRISGLDQYEQKKALDNCSVLAPSLKEIIGSAFQQPPKDKIPRDWEAWFGLATMNNNNADQFRRGIASLVLEQVKASFDDLEEEHKYTVAPWIIILEKITEEKKEG